MKPSYFWTQTICRSSVAELDAKAEQRREEEEEEVRRMQVELEGAQEKEVANRWHKMQSSAHFIRYGRRSRTAHDKIILSEDCLTELNNQDVYLVGVFLFVVLLAITVQRHTQVELQ
jgi:hypothetical protein